MEIDMSKQVFSDPNGKSGAMFSNERWADASDDWAQNDRWDTLANGEIVSAGEVIHSPLVKKGTPAYGIFQLRCAKGACWAPLGAVYVTDSPWQGAPFMWAETIRVTSAAPKPKGWRTCMILDSVTSSADIRSECSRHGIVTCKVSAVLDGVSEAIGKFQDKNNKPQDLKLT